MDVMSCVLIGSILLKIKQPRDQVWVPQGLPKGKDTFLLSSTWPQVLPIMKYQDMESPSPVRIRTFLNSLERKGDYLSNRTGLISN
jgi:hypothetical protein